MGRSKHQAGYGLEPARWLGGLLAVAFLLGLAQAASAQGAVRSVHGDWQIRCDTPPGAQGEQCALIQSVVAEDRSNAGLTVIVLKTADQKSKLMRVVAPLGVLLPSGLGLKLDNQDVGRAGFVRCLPNGCVAEVVMDDKLLGQLRTAKTATFIIFETPEEGIGFPLSLNGLPPQPGRIRRRPSLRAAASEAAERRLGNVALPSVRSFAARQTVARAAKRDVRRMTGQRSCQLPRE